MTKHRLLALTAFIALALSANLLTSHLGLVSIAGFAFTAGTIPAGLVLLARDWVHDAAGRWAVLVCIVVGAVLSAWLTPPQLAIASGAAFAVSELADFAVYAPLRRRGWVRAALASNLVGAIVDSVVFLSLAGFGLAAVPTQTVVKVAATVAVVIPVAVARAVLRDRVRPQGA